MVVGIPPKTPGQSPDFRLFFLDNGGLDGLYLTFDLGGGMSKRRELDSGLAGRVGITV